MTPLSFELLMDWALAGYVGYGSFFGVSKIYKSAKNINQLEIFGEKLDLPFGPAAGPHTQLAQNIIAAYAAGARFFELKTVQKLDGEDLPISKPCIFAFDEGYNVEWSTELYVHQAMEEYIKAYFALKLLSAEFGLGDPDGFIFNMSVGYHLDGIKTEKIDNFIEGLKNAEHTEIWHVCKSWAKDAVKKSPSRFRHIDENYIQNISPHVSRSITLSTLHGCPRSDIEKIAAYLICEKNLNTFIKCNPTLLGYEYVRRTLDDLGYGHVKFDDRHFKADLQFDDCVAMINKMQDLSAKQNLDFGVKLTNTLPVFSSGELPGEEMYLSGTPLFPLTIETASRLSKALSGNLRISFSGGADLHSIEAIYNAGIWPITLCTTLLKPGGYNRLYPMARRLATCELNLLDPKKIQALSSIAQADPYYRRGSSNNTNNSSSISKIKSRIQDLDSIKSCGCCINVCPNRANISTIKNGQPRVVHLHYLCNDCGNCAVFCPYYDTPCLEGKKRNETKQPDPKGENML